MFRGKRSCLEREGVLHDSHAGPRMSCGREAWCPCEMTAILFTEGCVENTVCS